MITSVVFLALIIFAAQLADVVSTNYALAHGLSEQNALMAALQKNLGSLWWVPKVTVGASLALAALSINSIPFAAVTAVASVSFVLWNVLQVEKNTSK